MNYENLSIEELKSVIDKAQTTIALKRKEKIEHVRAQIDKIIEDNNLLFAEVFPQELGSSRGKKAEPMFRDPENPLNTWTGKGRKPNWFIALIERGVPLENLKIRK